MTPLTAVTRVTSIDGAPGFGLPSGMSEKGEPNWVMWGSVAAMVVLPAVVIALNLTRMKYAFDTGAATITAKRVTYNFLWEDSKAAWRMTGAPF